MYFNQKYSPQIFKMYDQEQCNTCIKNTEHSGETICKWQIGII